ncbi:copper chaperone PCu(A)C [Streptomyces sp. NPDC055243]|uniref:copper chaperone PCu(A)C n=1 Tax=Streptomyces sp. NPDC055243 TaxID=3365720 RepID=UPI0037CD1E51
MSKDFRSAARGLRGPLLAALAPVTACAVALGGLTAWVGAGGAGRPARIEVAAGRVFLPYGDTQDTSAYFRITNRGGSADRLTGVTSDSPAADQAMLGRHRTTGGRAAYMSGTGSAEVPAHGTLAMSPLGVDVMLRARGRWQVGDTVPFTLHFRDGGSVRAEAVVVRPGAESVRGGNRTGPPSDS